MVGDETKVPCAIIPHRFFLISKSVTSFELGIDFDLTRITEKLIDDFPNAYLFWEFSRYMRNGVAFAHDPPHGIRETNRVKGVRVPRLERLWK
jgi:hypothetical protein